MAACVRACVRKVTDFCGIVLLQLLQCSCYRLISGFVVFSLFLHHEPGRRMGVECAFLFYLYM